MILARSASDFPFDRVAAGSAVTIGAFDGIHLGHQRLLARVQEEARLRSVPSVVMSFEPTPKEFFSSERPPARLMRFREKFEALRDLGIDIFFCPRFDERMKGISADAFIRTLLVHTLNTRFLEVGDDFRFASRRSGDIDMLQRVSGTLGYTVEASDSVVVGGERASSTSVRDALWTGDLDRATTMLGRPYRMSGRVVAGQRLGRRLGYPTANVDLRRKQSPVMGIFAVRVKGIGDAPLDGVASVGTRPTFDGSVPLLEVHIFDFDEDIYGRYIHVDFIGRIRDELKFDDAEQLIAQMDSDSKAARSILAKHREG